MSRAAPRLDERALRILKAAFAMTACGAAAAACTLDSDGTSLFSGAASSSTTSAGGGSSTSSGMGGSGMGGGGQGGGGGSSALAEWSAGPPDTTYTYSLPAWLVLESPSDNKTVQTGADTVKTGFGPNAARARSAGTAWGLNVESQRTNRLNTARVAQPGWELYSAGAVGPTLGPDGTMSAAHVIDNDSIAQTALIEQFTADLNQTATVSAWVAGITSGNQASIESNTLVNAPPASQASAVISSLTGWRRVSFTGTEVTGAAIDRVRPAYGDNLAVGSASFDLVSHETGKYPSSVIITAGAPVTRLAEKLYVNNAMTVAQDGWFHVVLTIAPNYASSEQSADHDLLYFDAVNRVFIRAVDHAVWMLAGAVPVLVTPGLSWTRERALTIEVVNTPTERTLNVSGADGGDVSVTSTTSAFPSVSTLYLLGNDMGAQECADLQSIRFFNAM